MTSLRGLIIGTGYFSQFHLDAWKRIRDVEIVGLCDRSSQSAADAAHKFQIGAYFTDAEAAINTTKPDFIDIITLPDARYEIVKLAVKYMIPLICQKPLADDYHGALALVELAKSVNLPLMVHENFRFQPWHREIKKIIASGVIGNKLHTITFRMRMGDGHGEEAYLSRQPYFREMPRLLIHETGIHFLDTFRFLGGEIKHVDARIRRLNPVIKGEDAGVITCEFEHGGIAIWDADRYHETTATDPRYTFGTMQVELSAGSIRLDETGKIFTKLLGQPEFEHQYHHERRGFAGDCVYFTQRHFIDCLLNKQPFETSGDEYLKSLKLVELAYDSAKSKSTAASVPISENDYHYIDLSLPISNKMNGVEISQANRLEVDGWNATTLSLYSHAGTHIDAPKHFLGDAGQSLEKQDLSVCCGLARVINLTHIKPSETITLENFGAALSQINSGERLLLRTDWFRNFGTEIYRRQMPGLSPELAKILVEKQVKLIGVEPPSVANVNDMAILTEVHHILFKGGVTIIEGLANLDKLHFEFVEFIAFPLHIPGGDGCPVRAVARVRRNV